MPHLTRVDATADEFGMGSCDGLLAISNQARHEVVGMHDKARIMEEDMR